MSTCEVRRAVTFALAAFAAVLAIGCGQTGACVRYSDCSVGYTCAAGQCVFLQTSSPPPASTDDAEVGTTDADTEGNGDAAATASGDGSVTGDGSIDGKASAAGDGASVDGVTPSSDAESVARDAAGE